MLFFWGRDSIRDLIILLSDSLLELKVLTKPADINGEILARRFSFVELKTKFVFLPLNKIMIVY